MKSNKIKILGIIFVMFVFYSMGALLIPFVVALIMAYALHAPADFVAKKCRLSSSSAAAIVVVLLISFFIFLAIFLVPLVKNVIVVMLEKMPKLLQTFPDVLNKFLQKIYSIFGINHVVNINDNFERYINFFTNNMPEHILNFINTGKTLLNVVMFMIMIPIITFYLLKDWLKIEISIMKILSKICSNKAGIVIRKINANLAKYVKGQLLICSILCVPYALLLCFAGVKEYLSCGFFSGFLSFIPFFGPFLSLLMTLALSFEDFAYCYQYGLVCSFYLLVPFLDSYFLTPKFIGQKTGTHPFWLLFSICATVSVLGLGGVLISVPIAVALSTLGKELFRIL